MCEKKLSLSQFAADKGKDKEEGEDEEAEAVVTSGKCEAALRHLGSTDSAQTVLFDWRPNFVWFFFFSFRSLECLCHAHQHAAAAFPVCVHLPQ